MINKPKTTKKLILYGQQDYSTKKLILYGQHAYDYKKAGPLWSTSL